MTEVPERIILAGDMAQHWGLALVSTKPGVGVFASCHYDAGHYYRTSGTRQVKSLERILEWTLSHTDGVDLVAYELPTPASTDSALAQGKMVGVLEQAAARLHACERFLTIRPSTLKKWATGYGQCDKPEMVARANELRDEAGYQIFDDNEADAVCIAAWAAEKIYAEDCLTTARQVNQEIRGE